MQHPIKKPARSADWVVAETVMSRKGPGGINSTPDPYRAGRDV